ncbi:MAG: GtrA family protein [Bacteroidales bacterium]|nr:GtrA family protein [Bacteroidales bacterium]
MTLKEIFVGKTENSAIQLIRNVIVEATRIAINMLILWLMYYVIFGQTDSIDEKTYTYTTISTVVASMGSGIVNFIFSTIWVFHKKQKNGNILRFVVFTLIGAVGLGLNTLITVVLKDNCGINLFLSNIVAQIVVFFFNFFMRKYIVYTKMSEEK